jgi:hypothetical protein
MYDQDVRELLRQLIKTRGLMLASHLDIIEECLMTACPDSLVEIQMLIEAGNEQMVEELLSPTNTVLPPAELVRRQTERIARALSTNNEAARWIVEAWYDAVCSQALSRNPPHVDQVYAERALAALTVVEQRRFGYHSEL